MNKKHGKKLCAAVTASLCLLLVSPQSSHADLTYHLRFDQSTYVVTPGSTLTVDLFLQELATDPDTNRLGKSGYGVMAATPKVTWQGGKAFVAASSDAKPADGFTLPAGAILGPGNLVMSLTANPLGDGVPGNQLSGPPGLREVALGTVTFTIPSDFSADTVITVDQKTPSTDPPDDFLIRIGPGLTADNFILIDPWLSSGTSVISLVPEPGSFCLVGVSLVCGAALWWKRRRDKTCA